MDQRITEYESWADLREYCRHSADPVGRLVLGLLRLDREPELVAASDDVCTGLQLVNFLQDVPRDLELGRIYLPAEDRARFGVSALDRPSPELLALLRFEAERARGLLASGRLLQQRIGGRTGRAVGLFARGGLAALEALEAARWDVFTQRPRPSRARLALAALRAVTTSPRLRRGRAPDPPARAQLRLRDHGAPAREAPCDRRDLRVRAACRRRRRRRSRSPQAKRTELEALARGLEQPPGTDAMVVALADARIRFPIPGEALHALVDGGLQDLEQTRYATFDELRGYCAQGGRSSRCCVRRGLRIGGRRARGDARHSAAADQHHARRARGLGARTRVPPAGRAGVVRRGGGRHRRAPRHRPLASADDVPGRARARLPRRTASACCGRSTAAARSASRRSRGSTARRSSGSRNGGSTSSTGRRGCRPSRSSASSVKACADEGSRRRRGPRRLCGRPRARRAGNSVSSTRHGRRSAGPSRRCRHATAIPLLLPTTASTSRSAVSPSTSPS